MPRKRQNHIYSKTQVAIWKRQHAAAKEAALLEKRRQDQEVLDALGSGWDCQLVPQKQRACVPSELENCEQWEPFGVQADPVNNVTPILLITQKNTALSEIKPGAAARNVDDFKPLLSPKKRPETCVAAANCGVAKIRGNLDGCDECVRADNFNQQKSDYESCAYDEWD
ncbi:hypothetical protein EDC01DRAFT_626766 [Geopyxis carbonaria]|nr:hypothetical protein EDC01DRAFT_626766 [Geopyxis carbonaria]